MRRVAAVMRFGTRLEAVGIVFGALSLRTRLMLVVLTLTAALAGAMFASLWALRVQAEHVDAGHRAYARQQWARRVHAHLLGAQNALADAEAYGKRMNLAGSASEAWPDGTVDELDAAMARALRSLVTLQQTPVSDPTLQTQLRSLIRQLESIMIAAEGESARLQRRWLGVQQNAVRGLATALILTVVIVALATWSQYVSIRAVFRKLNERVQRIASGRINERLPEGGVDKDLAELSKNVNLVAERLHGLVISLEERVRGQSTALARAERLASVGFLAAGVAHEINNPLAVIAGEAELLDTGKLPPEAAEAVAVIRDEAFRCKKITKRLLKLSTPGGAEAEAVDCRGVAAGILRNARTLAKERGVKLVCQVPKGLTIYADRIEIKQVLLNLVVNAIEADAATVRVAGVLDTERIGMAVLDDGRGLEAEQLLRVFEPFYTTKTGSPGAGGTGLGLALAYAIIEGSGGLLEAFSDGPNKGCRFVMSWPKRFGEPGQAVTASAAERQERRADGATL